MAQPQKNLFDKFSFDNIRLLILLIALFAVSGTLYLGLTSETALTGQHVRELQEEYDRIARENLKIEYDIAVSMQPTRIADRATQIGLAPIPPAHITYISNMPYRSTATVRGGSPIATSARSFSFLSWLSNLLARLGVRDENQSVEANANP